MNALLNPSVLRHEAIEFNKFSENDFLPSLEIALTDAYKKLELYKQNSKINFEDVMVALDDISEQVDNIAGIFFNLHSAHCTPELEKIAPEMSEKLTKFGNDIALDPIIFDKIKKLHDTQNQFSLSIEEKRILEITYKGFVRSGALLNKNEKEEMRKLDDELSKLGLQFSQNVLKATNSYQLVLEEKDLDGLPVSLKEAMGEIAEKKNQKGKFIVTLDFPIAMPFLTYSKRRDLREKVFKAQSSKAFKDEFDNQENILKLLKLRQVRAQLLGYKTHADFTLEERMAQNPEKVKSFLHDFYEKSLPHAKKELAKLQALALELDGIKQLERYDSAYYSEILKQKELSINDEILKPYFKIENVVDGIFKVANFLYNLEFKEVFDLPVYHSEVRVFEVFDQKKNKFIGLFYADFFPRETKKGGAWMTSFQEAGLSKGKMKRPHVSIVCNFTKPTKTTPSLLTLNEVTTLYHEFGHALHGLLSECKYKKVSGTNVYWDFVELPSQMMENWAMEKECLDLFATHYETGEKIPADLVLKIKKSEKFLEGLTTLRQIAFSVLDMSYHTTMADSIKDIIEFEKSATSKMSLFPDYPGTSTSCSFSHIFAGGYSSGYYSYKWAEVLDADAFDYFLENGIFNKDIAQKFRENILEKGGSEHPMDLYLKFRGKEPSVEPLLKRSGLSD
jgi:peptidyl-dipeptidase Dcp